MKSILILIGICVSLNVKALDSEIIANCRSVDLSNHIFVIKQDNGIKAAVHGADDFLIAYYDVVLENRKFNGHENWYFVGSGAEKENFQFGKIENSDLYRLKLLANVGGDAFWLDRSDVRCLLFDVGDKNFQQR